MAAAGLKPFCVIYSTFLQRGYDQIVHDVALQGLPVRFAIDRAGLVGEDGATHAGAFDLAYLSNLPGMVVMAASDEAELVRMVATARELDDRPSAFRYPRGEGRRRYHPRRGAATGNRPRPDRQRRQFDRSRFARRAAGRLHRGRRRAWQARSLHHGCGRRFAKPLDRALLLRLARDHEVVLTIEEGTTGGFGAHVLHLYAREGVLDRGLRIRTLTLPDRFIDHGKPDAMYQDAGLAASHIVEAALDCLGLSDRRRFPVLLRG